MKKHRAIISLVAALAIFLISAVLVTGCGDSNASVSSTNAQASNCGSVEGKYVMMYQGKIDSSGQYINLSSDCTYHWKGPDWVDDAKFELDGNNISLPRTTDFGVKKGVISGDTLRIQDSSGGWTDYGKKTEQQIAAEQQNKLDEAAKAAQPIKLEGMALVEMIKQEYGKSQTANSGGYKQYLGSVVETSGWVFLFDTYSVPHRILINPIGPGEAQTSYDYIGCELDREPTPAVNKGDLITIKGTLKNSSLDHCVVVN